MVTKMATVAQKMVTPSTFQNQSLSMVAVTSTTVVVLTIAQWMGKVPTFANVHHVGQWAMTDRLVSQAQPAFQHSVDPTKWSSEWTNAFSRTVMIGLAPEWSTVQIVLLSKTKTTPITSFLQMASTNAEWHFHMTMIPSPIPLVTILKLRISRLNLEPLK